MKTILPLEQNPIIKTYNHHLFTLGVLMLNPRFEEELYNNFINLWYSEDYFTYADFTTDFLRDFRYFERIKECYACSDIAADDDEGSIEGVVSLVQSNSINDYEEHILKTICDHIQEGYYVTGMFNELFLPDSHSYLKRNFAHNYFLYGFDDEKRAFMIYGYNKSGKCIGREVSFLDFSRCLFQFGEPSMHDINFFKERAMNRYSLDVGFQKHEIECYLSSVRTGGLFEEEEWDFTYGVSIYGKVKEHMQKDGCRIDLRTMRILLEHKLCMKNRLQLWIEQEIVSDNGILADYQQVISCFERTYLLSLKWQILSRQPETEERHRIVNQICDIIDEGCDMESSILEKLCGTPL